MIRFSHSPSAEEIAEALAVSVEEAEEQLNTKAVMIARSGTEWLLLEKKQVKIEEPEAPEASEKPGKSAGAFLASNLLFKKKTDETKAEEPKQKPSDAEESAQSAEAVPAEEPAAKAPAEPKKKKSPNVDKALFTKIAVAALAVILLAVGALAVTRSVRAKKAKEASAALSESISSLQNAIPKLRTVKANTENRWESEGAEPTSFKNEESYRFDSTVINMVLEQSNAVLTEYQGSKAADGAQLQKLISLRTAYKRAFDTVKNTSNMTLDEYRQRTDDALSALEALK